MCFAVRMVELVALVEPGCAWMIGRGTRPANAVLPVDSIPRNAVIIADAAFGSDTQLIKYFFGGIEDEFVGLAKARSYIADNPPIQACISGRIYDLLMVDHPAFHVGRGAFIFFHQRTCQHNICVSRRLRQEEVNLREELQFLESLSYIGIVGQ